MANYMVRADNFDDEMAKSMSLSKNVSKVLDQLLKDYDKRLRPNYAGQPVVVGITINVNNINSVSEVNMDYTLDMYIRQYWTDKRLAFDKFNDIDELVIGSDMLHKIWTPDTFLANERKSYFHKAPSHNKFIRISPNGQVLFSMRLTVTAACPMNFRFFPMDHQECNLEIESYGFRYEDIQYKWANGVTKSLDIAPGILLPQLKHKGSTLIERKITLSTGVYSRLTMTMFFMRHLGYYIIQIYIPSSMIVILSWVSFWLDRTAAPARVALGITTVLTMVTFIWSTNASLPKISYIKSIDVYLICCFFMTFASVIEYAIVSYIHHRIERRKRKLLKKSFRGGVGRDNNNNAANNNNNNNKKLSEFKIDFNLSTSSSKLYGNGNATRKSSLGEVIRKSNFDNGDIDLCDSMRTNITTFTQSTNGNKQQICEYEKFDMEKTAKNDTRLSTVLKIDKDDDELRRISENGVLMQYNKENRLMPNSKSFQNRNYRFLIQTRACSIKACTVDNYSRVLFPAAFLAFHIVYWITYLRISETLA